jgi:hypothetical protein
VLGGNAAFDEVGTFGFENAALEAGKGLADGDSASGGNDAVPRDGLTARASGHGSTGGPSAPGEPHGAGELTVRRDAAFGDALD